MLQQFVFILIVILISCNHHPFSKEEKRGASKSGVILQFDDAFYFLNEKETSEEDIEKLLLDSDRVSSKIYLILDNSGIKKVRGHFKPFVKDFYWCGEWSEKNRMKYALVSIRLKRNEHKITSDTEAVDYECLFRPSISIAYKLNYTVSNETIEEIELREL